MCSDTFLITHDTTEPRPHEFLVIDINIFIERFCFTFRKYLDFGVCVVHINSYKTVRYTVTIRQHTETDD